MNLQISDRIQRSDTKLSVDAAHKHAPSSAFSETHDSFISSKPCAALCLPSSFEELADLQPSSDNRTTISIVIVALGVPDAPSVPGPASRLKNDQCSGCPRLRVCYFIVGAPGDKITFTAGSEIPFGAELPAWRVAAPIGKLPPQAANMRLSPKGHRKLLKGSRPLGETTFNTSKYRWFIDKPTEAADWDVLAGTFRGHM